MNVGKAITRMRAELREAVGGSWNRDQLVGFLEDAQTEVFSRISTSGIYDFIAWKAFTYPANTYEVTLSNLIGARVHKVRQVRVMSSATAPTSSDSGYLLEPIFSETDLMGTALQQDEVDGEAQGCTRIGQGYYLVGDRFQIQPIPQQNVYIFMRFTPKPPSLDTDDVELWNGELPDFHYVLVLHAARAALSTIGDEKAIMGITARYIQAADQMIADVSQMRQQQQNAHPRFSDPDADFA